MFALRSVAIVVLCGALATGAVAGGGPQPPPPPPPPLLQITEFTAVTDGGMLYTFEGRVTGGNGTAITIMFGEAPSMVGKSCTVQEDGTFTFTIQLMADDYGPVSAQAVDRSGDKSDYDFVYVLR